MKEGRDLITSHFLPAESGILLEAIGCVLFMLLLYCIRANLSSFFDDLIGRLYQESLIIGNLEN